MSLVNLLLWLMLALVPLVSALLLAEQNEAKKTTVQSYVRAQQRNSQDPVETRTLSRLRQARFETESAVTTAAQFFDLPTADSVEPVNLNFDWMEVSCSRTKKPTLRDTSSVKDHCA